MFHKQYKKQNSFFNGEPTIISNIHEASFNPWKNYYSLIKIDDQLIVKEYRGKFRSEALSYFEEVARLNRGKIDTFGVLK